jgi:O-antigen/teichoic acid export membrane protein
MDKDSLIRRRVAFGTASNVTGQLLIYAISFLLTPFLLNQLGATLYGLWILVSAVAAYGSILDFGLWGALIKYVAEYQAQGQAAATRRLLGAAFALYLVLGLMIAAAGMVVAPFFPQLFHLPPEQHQTAVQLVALMALTTGLALPCMMPLAVLRGLQRYDLVNLIDVGSNLVLGVAMVGVLLLGGGVIGLALAQLASLGVAFVAGFWTLRRLTPTAALGWPRADRQTARLLMNYGWPLFLRDVAGRLQTRSDEIVIGLFMPVRAVGSYNIARRLSEATQTLARQFMKTLLPLASQLNAERDHQRLAALYKTGTRLSLAIMLVLGGTLVALAGPILAWWISSEYAALAGVVALLTAANLVAAIQWPATAILQATARHRVLAFSSLGAGLANLLLSIALVRPLGLAGVALGTLIPAVVEYLCVILPYSLRVTGVRPQEAMAEIYLPALLPALPMAVILYWLRVSLEPASLPAILAVGIVACATYGVGYVLLSATASERRTVLAGVGSLTRLVRTRLSL